MAKLRREIAHMKTARETRRVGRRRNHVPAVAIVGYTNAGKSSLLNRLTGAGVLVENSLFATLDPTVRKTTTPDGRVYTLADTVGFVRSLPHQLVEAFRSTLEEVGEADLVLHIVDGSHPDPEGQIAAVHDVLAEVHAASVPELIVVNKTDAADPATVDRLLRRHGGALAVSAYTGEGLEALVAAVAEGLPRPDVLVDVLVPFSRGDLVNRVHTEGEVEAEEHTASGTVLRARVSGQLAAELGRYSVSKA
jgi:GTP-binding protein HflX